MRLLEAVKGIMPSAWGTETSAGQEAGVLEQNIYILHIF